MTAIVSTAVLALAPASMADVVETCRTRACEARVQTRQWRDVVRPYRGWLHGVRLCESGGDYSTNTGNHYYGAYQFSFPSWRAVGGRGLPHRAAPIEQDYRAVRLRRVQGRRAWPVCG